MKTEKLRIWYALLARDLKESLLSPAPWILATLAGLLVVLTIRNTLSIFDTESTLVASEPAGVPVALAIVISSLYIALASATSVASEKEHRTLEVLLCGPVTPGVFVMAKFARDALLFLLLMSIVLVNVALIGAATNLGFRWRTAGSVLASVFFVLPVLGASLLVSAAVQRARTAVVVIVIAYVLLALGEGAGYWALSLPVQDLSLATVYLREILIGTADVLSWVSPLSYVGRAARIVMGDEQAASPFLVAVMLAYAGSAAAAASLLLCMKGATR